MKQLGQVTRKVRKRRDLIRSFVTASDLPSFLRS
jgi:hypothetical protein